MMLTDNSIWYSKRGTAHTRCNICEAHTDQILYQNQDDQTFIQLCSCWTDSIMDRDTRAVIQRRSLFHATAGETS